MGGSDAGVSVQVTASRDKPFGAAMRELREWFDQCSVYPAQFKPLLTEDCNVSFHVCFDDIKDADRFSAAFNSKTWKICEPGQK
jgi:hypothetical protein